MERTRAHQRYRAPGPARWAAAAAVVVAVAALGLGLERAARPVADDAPRPAGDVPDARATRAADGAARAAEETPRAAPAAAAAGADPRLEHAVAQHFQRGVALLHARQPEYAAVAFHEVLRLAPRLPEAHVNMGYALLAQQRPGAARDFFIAAIELRPSQANAYYGLGVASEALGDMPAALGAMRSFVHLAPPDDPFVTRARSALWEWQSAGAPAPGDAGRPAAAPARAGEGGSLRAVGIADPADAGAR